MKTALSGVRRDGLWPWEQATVAVEELGKGWVERRWLGFLSLIFMAFFGATGAFFGTAGAVSGMILGRLVALDLVYLILPDIYTLPLLAAGVVWAWGQGYVWDVVLVGALLLLVLGGLMRLGLGLGWGDVKLLGAMLAWLGPVGAMVAMLAGCVLWLPFACWRPRVMQPFGVPLIVGSVAVLVACGVFKGGGGLCLTWLTPICLICD